jgi:hypothetical protein
LGALGLVLFPKIKRCFPIMRPPLKGCRDTRLRMGSQLLNLRSIREHIVGFFHVFIANKRKLTAELVRKEVFDEIGGRDEDGQSLRQRTGYACC